MATTAAAAEREKYNEAIKAWALHFVVHFYYWLAVGSVQAAHLFQDQMIPGTWGALHHHDFTGQYASFASAQMPSAVHELLIATCQGCGFWLQGFQLSTVPGGFVLVVQGTMLKQGVYYKFEDSFSIKNCVPGLIWHEMIANCTMKRWFAKEQDLYTPSFWHVMFGPPATAQNSAAEQPPHEFEPSKKNKAKACRARKGKKQALNKALSFACDRPADDSVASKVLMRSLSSPAPLVKAPEQGALSVNHASGNDSIQPKIPVNSPRPTYAEMVKRCTGLKSV